MDGGVECPKALAVFIWNKYFRKFYWFVKEKNIEEDLQQTMELAALSVNGSKDLSKVILCISRVYNQFLKDNGLSRITENGKQKFVNRETHLDIKNLDYLRHYAKPRTN